MFFSRPFFSASKAAVIHVLLSSVPDTHRDQSVNLGGNRR